MKALGVSGGAGPGRRGPSVVVGGVTGVQEEDESSVSPTKSSLVQNSQRTNFGR